MYLHLDKDQLKGLALTVVDLTVNAYILSDREYVPSSSKTIHLALNPEARAFIAPSCQQGRIQHL